MSTPRTRPPGRANNVTYQRCRFAYEFAVPYITGKDVLDVGCGNAYGTALMRVRPGTYKGVDYDARPRWPITRSVTSSITNLSFRRERCRPCLSDQSFDVVTAFQFIEHIEAEGVSGRVPARPAPRRATVGHDSNVKKSLARNPFTCTSTPSTKCVRRSVRSRSSSS